MVDTKHNQHPKFHNLELKISQTKNIQNQVSNSVVKILAHFNNFIVSIVGVKNVQREYDKIKA